MATSSTALTGSRRSFAGFWLPLLIVLAAAGVIAFLQLRPADDFGPANMMTNMVGVLAVLLLTVWVVALSGWAWAGRLAVVVPVLLLFGYIGISAARKNPALRFTGDMRPSLRLPWQTDPDDALEAHRSRQAADGVPPADLAERPTDFPEYRGVRRDGTVTAGPPLARDWTAKPPKLVWKQPVGGGWAAFAVRGNVAVTIEQRRDHEAVVWYDTATGRERWVHSYPDRFSEPLGGPGPRATPTIAGGDVYSLGANGKLVCLDAATGKLKWEVNVLADNDNISWAMSGSPLVYDNVVVVNPGAQRESAKGRALVAYDRATGKQVWASGDTRAGYSSPMLATLAGKRQVLLFDAEVMAGYAAADGTRLWTFPWGETNMGINVAQPLVLDGDRVFISSGYGIGSTMLKVTESGGTWKAEDLWNWAETRRNRPLRCKFTSPVYHQGHIYGMDEGILSCIDAADGKLKWKGGRYGNGQLLLVGDLLVILAEDGKLLLVEAKSDGENVLGRVSALEGKTWNVPALADGKVYVRNDAEMACYDLSQ